VLRTNTTLKMCLVGDISAGEGAGLYGASSISKKGVELLQAVLKDNATLPRTLFDIPLAQTERKLPKHMLNPLFHLLARAAAMVGEEEDDGEGEEGEEGEEEGEEGEEGMWID
jgi:hypothetical protein